MNSRAVVALFSSLLLTGLHSDALAANDTNVTTEGIVVALPKSEALEFIAKQNLHTRAGDGLKELQKLVDQKKAESIANPAVISKSGQHALSDVDGTSLEVEALVPAIGGTIDTSVVFKHNGKRLVTRFKAKDGDVKFLGAVDSTDKEKNVTYLVFVRIRVSL